MMSDMAGSIAAEAGGMAHSTARRKAAVHHGPCTRKGSDLSYRAQKAQTKSIAVATVKPRCLLFMRSP
jgi:hypothetical protein